MFVYDHLGQCFNNLSAMCYAYGVDENVFKIRLEMGYPMDSALLVPFHDYQTCVTCVDHNGVQFMNLGIMCECYGISLEVFNVRVASCWPLWKILTTPAEFRC